MEPQSIRKSLVNPSAAETSFIIYYLIFIFEGQEKLFRSRYSIDPDPDVIIATYLRFFSVLKVLQNYFIMA